MDDVPNRMFATIYPMIPDLLHPALASVPPGPWAVAVSGGADSVALLRLLLARRDVHVHVVHLDHQTREGESTNDAAFVHALCNSLAVPFTLGRRSEWETRLPNLPANRSARYREVRQAFFGEVVQKHDLMGVILAHHADDQIETILLRLLRSASVGGLRGMNPDTSISALRQLRPLLYVSRDTLRAYLQEICQPWREDASNAQNISSRNRLRNQLVHVQRNRDDLYKAIVAFQTSCISLNAWSGSVLPHIDDHLSIHQLAQLPNFLRAVTARKWLLHHGVPISALSPGAVRRLIEMAVDRASPRVCVFPGSVRVARKGYTLMILPA